MLLPKVAIALTILLSASRVMLCDAICKVPKDVKEWREKSITDRAKASDIIIYGEVVYSPCWKPGYVKPTTPLTTTIFSGNTSTNATINATVSTPQMQTGNATTAPTTPLYKCSSEFYNATIKVLCVIKGGSVPLFILLEGLGQGSGVCLDESYHDYHAYNQLKYLIFMGR